ncbi:phospholipase A1-like isoform X1 [Diabrotica virgifera virgifera]|uniref:Lipase domain-containing protein n=1 Tax=Diabrotica virgifera virgifera TaxID=50390 RepID=A0ABM5JVN2_DIAVI|nr:phospholipase A1-like isoform X1 [Diabrotica virgifera virgifera]
MHVITLQFQISVIFILAGMACGNNYSRKLLQKKYPGFGTDYIIFPGENGEDVYGYYNDKRQTRFGIDIFDLPFLDYDFSNSINFTLFTRDAPYGWLVDDPDKLPNYLINNTQVKFITHGWMSKGTADNCVKIKDAFLEKHDFNVFIMDWSSVSGNPFYPVPMEATPHIGQEYAKFINILIGKMNVNPKDIHLIGHSLGAHISGFAGRRTKGRVSRITGLDPALPGFDINLVKGDRLNRKDADFVDIIHTCAGFLGIRDPIGHVDFYPNGGAPPQPGCTILKFVEACSHGRSWKLFANSIKLDQEYAASRCPNLASLANLKCVGKNIPMGYPTPPTARGIFYIETTSEEPYIKPFDFVDKNKVE